MSVRTHAPSCLTTLPVCVESSQYSVTCPFSSILRHAKQLILVLCVKTNTRPSPRKGSAREPIRTHRQQLLQPRGVKIPYLLEYCTSIFNWPKQESPRLPCVVDGKDLTPAPLHQKAHAAPQITLLPHPCADIEFDQPSSSSTQ